MNLPGRDASRRCRLKLVAGLVVVLGLSVGVGFRALDVSAGGSLSTAKGSVLLALGDFDEVPGKDLVLYSPSPNAAFDSSYITSQGKLFLKSAVGSVILLSGLGDGRFWLSRETLLYQEVLVKSSSVDTETVETKYLAGSGSAAGAVMDCDGNGTLSALVLAAGKSGSGAGIGSVGSGKLETRTLPIGFLLSGPDLSGLSFLNGPLFEATGALETLSLMSMPNSVAVGDFDRDGKADLAMTSAADYKLLLFHGTGNGSFEGPKGGGEVIGEAGKEPSCVAVGDVNGDGKQDIVYALGADIGNLIGVRLGAGDGSFYPPETATYRAGSKNPRSLLVGDFNRDRRMDVIVATELGGLYFLKGAEGDQDVLSAPEQIGDVEVPAGRKGAPIGLVSGEFDNHGILDFAVANTGLDRIDVYRNSGTGSFELAGSYLEGSDLRPISLVAGDVDGDGDTDLVVSGETENSVVVLLNDGAGQFEPLLSPVVPLGTQAVTVGAISTQGKSDLLFSQALPEPSVRTISRPDGWTGKSLTTSIFLHSDGQRQAFPALELIAGAFGEAASPPVSSQTPEPAFVRALYTAGLNGNRRDEAIVLWHGRNVVAIGTAPEIGGWESATWREYDVGTSPIGCVAVDVDGDSNLDLAVLSAESRNITLLHNDGSGHFTPLSDKLILKQTPNNGTPNSIAAGDFNNDKTADLAVCSSDGISIFFGQRGGSFGSETRLAGSYAPTSLVAGDFDGKGETDDLAFVSAASGQIQIYVLLSAATGFGEPVPVGTGSLATSIVAVDYDGDTLIDLLAAARDKDKGLLFFKGDGKGGFAPPVAINQGRDLAGVVGPIGQVRAIAARGGDVAVLGDVRAASAVPQGLPQDLFLVSATLLATGDTSNPPTCSPNCPPPTQVLDVASGDFDDNGAWDIALLVTRTGTDGASSAAVVTWLGSRGDGGFVGGAETAVPLSSSLLAAGDIDGDGFLDLAVVGTSKNTVTPLWGLGDGTFTTGAPLDTVVAPSVVQVIEGVGLAVGSMQLEILAGASDSPRNLKERIRLDVNGYIVATAWGDLNEDGFQDLIVATVNPSAVVVFSGTVLKKGLPDAPPVMCSAVAPIDGTPTALAEGLFGSSGRPEVVLALGDRGEVRVIRSFDDGTVEFGGSLSAGGRPLLVASGDFNGDLFEDVAVVTHRPPGISFLYGTGRPDVSLVEVARSLLPLAEAPTRVVAGDWNGDGRTDLLAIRRGADYVSFLWNSVTAPRGLTLGNLQLRHASFLPQATAAVAAPPVAPAAPLAVLASTAAVRVPSKQLGFVYQGRSWVATGDVNGDGMVDVVLACADTKTVSVLLGTGLRERPLRWTATVDLGSAPQGPAVLADWDDDGAAEVAVVLPSQNEVALFDDLGQGQLAAQVRVPTGVVPVSASAGDFDGDRMADLAVLCQGSRELLVFDGTNLWMGEPQPTRIALPDSPGLLAVADFNSDGVDDFVTTDFLKPQIALYLSNRGPAGVSFSARTVDALPTGTADVVLVGDLDLDLAVDLIVAGGGAEPCIVLLNGYSQFAAGNRETIGSDPRDGVLCDLDQDGVLDLVTIESGTGLVLAWHNVGGGSFAQQPANYVSLVESDPWDLASGDFDVDGKVDVFVSTSSGRLGIIWGQEGKFLVDEKYVTVYVE
jgi:hypothetical protein